MGNLTLIIIVLYILYYAGNILYDGFIKKEISNSKDEGETFSIETISEQNSTPVVTVGIEDVEEMNTPKSFNKREIFDEAVENATKNYADLENLRKRFETEQELDGTSEEISDEEFDTNSFNEMFENSDGSSSITSILEKEKKAKIDFKKFLNLAETSIKIISKEDGTRIYQTTI